MSNSVPPVDVIMSVYNDEDYLTSAIDSIINQTYENIRVIVVDDDSDDNSWRVLKTEYSDISSVELVRNNSNKGLPYSLNRAARISSAPLIARMDSDDISVPNRIAEQVRSFVSCDNLDVLYTSALIIDSNRNIVTEKFIPPKARVLKELPSQCYIPHPSVMFTRSFFKDIGGYNESFRRRQDVELWYRARSHGATFKQLGDALLLYRVEFSEKGARSGAFQKAVTCITHNNKMGALKYLSDLDSIEILFLFMRLIIPFKLYMFKKSLREAAPRVG